MSTAILLSAIGIGSYLFFAPDDKLLDSEYQVEGENDLIYDSSQAPKTGITPEEAAKQATKVLDSFGLDAGGGLTGENGTPGAGEAVFNVGIPDSQRIVNNNDSYLLAAEPVIKSDLKSIKLRPLVSVLLLNEGISNQIWDYFIAAQIDIKIAQQKELTAHHLSQQITDLTHYIDAQGALLREFSQADAQKDIYSAIETRIRRLPLNKQGAFFARAGLYQYLTDNSFSFFDQADILWKSDTAAEDQIDTILRLAVSYAILGKIKAANQYFGEINKLLGKLSSVDKKIYSRVAIAKAYKDAGSKKNALQWLLSTNKLITDTSSTAAYTDLVTGYAYLGQLENTLKIIQQHPSQIMRDAFLFQAIQVFVDTKAYSQGNRLLAHIQRSDYKAASYILMASGIKDNEHYLAQIESLINNKIDAPLDQAIVSSYLALQYLLQSNPQKTQAFYNATRGYLNTIKLSPEKDEALGIITINFARTYKAAYTEELLTFIQSPLTQARLRTETNRILKSKSLIN